MKHGGKKKFLSRTAIKQLKIGLTIYNFRDKFCSIIFLSLFYPLNYGYRTFGISRNMSN